MPNQNPSDPSLVLIAVPRLRPQPGAERNEPWLRYFDPGVRGLSGPLYRPDDLPLDEDQVAAMLANFSALARETRSPGELDGLRPGVYDDFHADTSFAIEDELADSLTGRDRGKALRQARTRAQTLACLALSLEAQADELGSLALTLDSQWKKFGDSLDLTDENLDEALEGDHESARALKTLANPVATDQAGRAVSASAVVEAVLTLAGPGVGLFSDDADLRASWEEFGASFAPCDVAGLLKATLPGYRLALGRRDDPDKPWLTASRDAYVPAS